MTIGTAGYTAMLAVLALEDHGHTPDSGATVVTGSAGGVGSVSIALLSALGHSVIASTGRPEEAGYLASLGASEIIARSELEGAARPLGKPRWAGGIDSVGGAKPWPMFCRAPTTAVWSQPAVWPEAWTYRARWPPSSSAG